MEKQLAELMQKVGLGYFSVNENKGQEIKYFQGRGLLPHFSWDSINYARNEWKMPENTVIVASYLKTGTAWCMEILRQMLSGGNDDLLQKVNSLPGPINLLDFGGTEKFELYPNLPIKLLATHTPADLFNFDKIQESKSKIVLMYRNPKDQAVSWYHFANKLPFLNDDLKGELLGKNWNDFFEKYTAGKHPTGMGDGQWYLDHLKTWMSRAKVDKNILPVEYESLKRDFPAELRRIAKFIGVELNEYDVERINNRCTFLSMKSKAGGDKSGFLKANVRKGEVGGWKEQLTVSQSEHIDRLVEEKLAGTGIKFTYEL